MIGNLLQWIRKAKEYYVDHTVDYKKTGEDDTYIIGIFIRVKAPEEQIASIVPLIDKFIGNLFKKGKIVVPLPKDKADKIKKFTKIKLRFQGKDITSV